MKVISIHQPNFIPWLPFFEKIYHSDLFVILGNCQFEKNNYQNRFQYENKWMTMPVKHGNIPIKDKEYIDPYNNWGKICEKIPKHKRLLESFRYCISTSLYCTNVSLIFNIMFGHLRINTKAVDDYPTDLTGTDRLVDICVRNDADVYLSGPSGKKYLELQKFEKAGIQVKFFEAENKIDIVTFLGSDM